ncbi:hypothetical protein CHELA1G11_13007 [Hyphomicrobiales bacterium]|nr:hypothetical protein CHELA1G2_11303 [Hyphomicrobiales bacterium]CAH1668654.1 hypothetical protein CHELA1G11_13007 [Hyphomicrobiales bacterium]
MARKSALYRSMDDIYFGPDEESCGIYVMEDDRGYVKIGRSYCPGTRCLSMQTGHPWPLKVAWAGRGRYKEVIKLEREVHKWLEDTVNKMNGEWYLMDTKAAVGAIERRATTLKIMIKPDWLYVFEDGLYP